MSLFQRDKLFFILETFHADLFKCVKIRCLNAKCSSNYMDTKHGMYIFYKCELTLIF